MPNFTNSVAAATAILGYDLLTGQPWARSPKNRAITAVSFTGSAAAGDAAIDLFIDEVRIGTYYNTSTGLGDLMSNIPLEMNFIPAGSQLRAIVTDAPATNPVFLRLSLMDV